MAPQCKWNCFIIHVCLHSTISAHRWSIYVVAHLFSFDQLFCYFADINQQQKNDSFLRWAGKSEHWRNQFNKASFFTVIIEQSSIYTNVRLACTSIHSAPFVGHKCRSVKANLPNKRSYIWDLNLNEQFAHLEERARTDTMATTKNGSKNGQLQVNTSGGQIGNDKN